MIEHKIYLASNSPRRCEILENLNFKIQKLIPEIDEKPDSLETANEYVMRMAKQKNQCVRKQYSQYIVENIPLLSADTVVVLNQKILGKPRSRSEAQTMLMDLSGKIHQVFTAVCVYYQCCEYSILQSSDVQFKLLTSQEIKNYIQTGEPMDKAGAYGIQGLGGAFVSHLSGSYTGVMGLPVFETMQLLHQCGFLSD